jgi:hypothetical protein
MRGTDEKSGSLFSYVDLGGWIPVKHPLLKIRRVVNHALSGTASRSHRSRRGLRHASPGIEHGAPELLKQEPGVLHPIASIDHFLAVF